MIDARRRRFRNWSGQVRSDFDRYAAPTDEGALCELIAHVTRDGQRVRVVGAGHSWSAVAAPEHVCVSLDALSGVVRVDPAAGEVTVRAGTRLHALTAALDAQGLAMPILGSIAEQTVGGSIATGTHGSGVHHGNLASLVRRLRLVTADGTVLDLGPDDPRLAAARVSLGALGVVSEVTFAVVPAFRLAETVTTMPIDEAIGQLPGLLTATPFAKVWWLPHTNTALSITCVPTDEAPTEGLGSRRVDAWINRWAFGPLLRLGEWLPVTVPTINRAVGLAYFRPRRRVNRSDLVFNLVMPPVHRETEQAIPLAVAGDALAALVDQVRSEAVPVGFINELRVVRADDAWLSPAYGRDSAQLGAYIHGGPHADTFLRGFQERMSRLGGRAHWGKELHLPFDDVRASYPRFEDFRRLREELDPEHTFANPFLDGLFGGS